MKICYNEATMMKNASLEQSMELCEKYGYDYIEIRLDKLKDYLDSHTVENLVDFFRSHELKPYAFNALEFISFRDKEGYDQILADFDFLVDVGLKIDCKKIVTVPSFSIGDYTISEIEKETARALKDLSDRAEKVGFKIAFEFCGDPTCSVNTLKQTNSIIKAVNRDNVGIVFDCFHFHAMNSRIEDLYEVDPGKIFVFHIDDVMDLPIGWLQDKHRLWPGEGAIDLDLIMTALKKIGYGEMASVELFNEDIWEWDLDKAFKAGMDTTKKVVSKYFGND